MKSIQEIRDRIENLRPEWQGDEAARGEMLALYWVLDEEPVL